MIRSIGFAKLRANANEQTIEAVVDDRVALDVGTDAIPRSPRSWPDRRRWPRTHFDVIVLLAIVGRAPTR